MQIVLKPATTSSHRAVSYGEVHCPFLYTYTRLPTHTCTRHARYTGSLGFEDVDAQSFVEWGFDFVKHDTCGGYNGTSRTSHESRFTAMRLSLGARKMVLFTAAGCGRGHSFQPPDIILLRMCACTFQFMRTCAFMVTYCVLAFIVLYKGEPYDECGVGNDASGFNCIKNSTSAMSKALQKYGQQANKKIVYYIDHGRAPAVNVWPMIQSFLPSAPSRPLLQHFILQINRDSHTYCGVHGHWHCMYCIHSDGGVAGNPTSPQRMYNPKQYYVSSDMNGQSDVSKLATKPSQLGWTWAADVCHMMKVCFDTNDSWDSML